MRLLIVVLSGFLATAAMAQEAGSPPEPPMTLDRLGEIVLGLDPQALAEGNAFQMTIEEVPVIIITDPSADRMRAMVPIRSIQGIAPEELSRMMQANFDTALDARYAIAQGRLWSTFIHPLSPLEKNQFISALGQVVNLARTYGSLYTGGALTFRGGDSEGIHRALIDELLEKGDEI
ncbi:MAG: type III secretion system chaperone [Pseudomonadota bacterium]